VKAPPKYVNETSLRAVDDVVITIHPIQSRSRFKIWEKHQNLPLVNKGRAKIHGYSLKTAISVVGPARCLPLTRVQQAMLPSKDAYTIGRDVKCCLQSHPELFDTKDSAA